MANIVAVLLSGTILTRQETLTIQDKIRRHFVCYPGSIGEEEQDGTLPILNIDSGAIVLPST